MPQIRGTQLQNLTIRDAQVAADAAIKQSKIDDSSGWISDGIMHICTTLTEPSWDGSQNGLLYYLEDSQELIMGTNTSPFYTVVGKKGGRWNVKVTRIDGEFALDWDGTYGTEFKSSVPLNQDGSNSLIYLNGVLHRIGENYDYTILSDLTTIKFNYTISQSDVVSIIVYADDDISTLLDGYVTKSELRLPTAGISGSTLIGVAPIQNVQSNILQNVLEEMEYKLDNNLKQYDHVTISKMGSEADDWNGINGSLFSSPQIFSIDGSNLFVYNNGQLLKMGSDDDYTLPDETHIQLTFDASSTDRITISIMTNLSMSSYATYPSLSSTVKGYSGASKIGVTITAGLASNNVQDVLEDLGSSIASINSNITVKDEKIGFFGTIPQYAIDIRSNDRINSKSGYITQASCIGMYFKAESSIQDGDLVGINVSSGIARKYIDGDEWIGVAVPSAGYILNANYEIEQDATYRLVGIKGKLHVDQTQVILSNRIMTTKDGKKIGIVLVDGDLFI